MDEFINFLDGYKIIGDEKIIVDFKEKLNKPVRYLPHFANYKYTEKWFSILDDILVELGYRALDADIEIIKKKVRRILLCNDNEDNVGAKEIGDRFNIICAIRYRNVTKLDKLYSGDEFIKWLMQYYPNRIIWEYLSKNETDFVVKYLIDNPNKIYEREFRENKNPIAVKYIEKTNLCKVPKSDPNYIFILVTNDGIPDKCLDYNAYLYPHDTCILSMWYLYKFDKLNWLPRSGLKFF